MNFEVSTLSKSLIAHGALERLDVLVGADMNLEATSSRVRLGAVGTLKRQLTRVDKLMSL